MIWESALELTHQKQSFVIVTVTEIKGSAPQDLGAKCLVSIDGLEAGTVGGGKVEARAIEKAQELLISRNDIGPLSLTWNLQRDIKMTCGGEMTLLFETFKFDDWSIAIFGAGHVSQALCRGLSRLNCRVSVIDPRKEWLDKLEDIKGLQILECASPEKLVDKFSEKTFFISITKGHDFDVPVLTQIFHSFPNAPYVGVIGSQSKANAIKKDLEKRNVSSEFIQKIKIPIGLPIGNNDPEEISISIMAELLQVRDSLR